MTALSGRAGSSERADLEGVLEVVDVDAELLLDAAYFVFHGLLAIDARSYSESTRDPKNAQRMNRLVASLEFCQCRFSSSGFLFCDWL